jgi:perosamine synthetase
MFKARNTMRPQEIIAAQRVIEAGSLSDFLGCWHQEKFFGGTSVKALESKFSKKFGVKHAISVNSWTSGLICAMGSIGLEPGDEVITTPWTMSATAMAIIHWNGIPIFADIDPDTYNLDPNSVLQAITPKTKAILAADIFGLPCDTAALSQIAKDHGLRFLTDSAQAPGAKVGDAYCGIQADIGGFSFNYHKHIHCGEGGMIVTNDDSLAKRVALIRNHAESVVDGMKVRDIANMIGFNFRMTEIEAAIAFEQLDLLDDVVNEKQKQAAILDSLLGSEPGLSIQTIPTHLTSAYYVYPIRLDTSRILDGRDMLMKKTNGNIPLMGTYQNIHLLPIFQQKIAYGTSGIPWTISDRNQEISYKKGICPVAEELFDHSFVGIPLCSYDFSDDEIHQIGLTIRDTWRNIYNGQS